MRRVAETIGSVLTPAAALLVVSGCASPVATTEAELPPPSSETGLADHQYEPSLPGEPPAFSLDPFASRPGQWESGYSNILPVAQVRDAEPTAVDGNPTAPEFGMFGELPNAAASNEAPRAPFDPTENIQQITFATEGSDFDPVITPDGQRVVFASTRHRPTADIYIQTIHGTAVTQLTSDPAHDVMPAISPDGKRIAFSSNRNGSWDIYIMNVEGGQAVQVTSDTSAELHPSWSADGTHLAYCRLAENADRWEIWVADLNRPAARTFITFGLFPEWHPFERRILFQRSRERGDRYFSIWTVDYVDGEGVSPTEVASSSIAAVINPTWSRDGRFIACSTAFLGDEGDPTNAPDFADIWMLDAHGANRTNLTGGFFVNIMPAWGLDNELYFVSNRTGADTVWSIDPSQAIVAAGLDPNPSTVPTYVTAPVEDDAQE